MTNSCILKTNYSTLCKVVALALLVTWTFEKDLRHDSMLSYLAVKVR